MNMNPENETRTGKNERPTLDQRFKSVISDSDVLSWILHGNVDELKDRSIDEIKSCLKLGEDGRTVIGRDRIYDSDGEGRIELDTAFDIDIPGPDGPISVIVGVEGQNDPNPRYPLGKRAEYYLARMVSSQKNMEFENSNYGDIRKTYSIWCILDPRKRYRGTVVRYRMEPEVFSRYGVEPDVLDTFNIILAYVGEYGDDLPEGLGFISAMFCEMDKAERRELMRNKFNIELNDDILESVKDMSLDEDQYNYGHRVGRAEGLSEAAFSLTKKMDISLDEALEILSVPESCREEIRTRVRTMSC